MQIVIVGGGIAGFSAYLFLRKRFKSHPSLSSISIKIFESHNTSPTPEHVNATLEGQQGLASSSAIVGGGLATSPNGMRVLRDLDLGIHRAFTEQGFLCEHFTFKAARGFQLVKASTSDGRKPPEYSVSSSRHGLWDCLRKAVEPEAIVFKELSEIVKQQNGRLLLRFVKGGDEEADLVIGADGVRSAVKKAMFGEENDEKYAPRYEGLIGVGGF
ncbi:hypothetical protein LTS18_009037, partial [Coniosporium uncinatum]